MNLNVDCLLSNSSHFLATAMKSLCWGPGVEGTSSSTTGAMTANKSGLVDLRRSYVSFYTLGRVSRPLTELDCSA